MAGSDSDIDYTKQIRTLVLGLVIIASVFAAYFGRDFILPVTLAFLLALTFRPAIRWLAKRGMPAWLTTALALMVLMLVALTGVYVISGSVAVWVSDAPRYAEIFTQKLSVFRSSFDALVSLSEKLESATQVTQGTAALPEVVLRQSPWSGVAEHFFQVTGYSASVVTTIALTLVIAAFLMASGDLFYEKLVRVLPTLTDKKRALRIVYDVEREVSSYLLTVSAINLGFGIAVGVTFYLLGMPTPYLWGALAFFFNFIPYVGALCGIALSGFVSIAVFNSAGAILLPPLLYLFWNGIESQLVTPLFLGRRLELNAVAILLALTFWTWLWGIAGTMVAVPILVTFKVFCDHLEGLSGLGEFLSGRQPDDAQMPASESVPGSQPSKARP